MKDKPPF